MSVGFHPTSYIIGIMIKLILHTLNQMVNKKSQALAWLALFRRLEHGNVCWRNDLLWL